MGRYTYQCPGCWSQQTVKTQPTDSAHPLHALCPGCQEIADSAGLKTPDPNDQQARARFQIAFEKARQALHAVRPGNG